MSKVVNSFLQFRDFPPEEALLVLHKAFGNISRMNPDQVVVAFQSAKMYADDFTAADPAIYAMLNALRVQMIQLCTNGGSVSLEDTTSFFPERRRKRFEAAIGQDLADEIKPPSEKKKVEDSSRVRAPDGRPGLLERWFGV